MAHYLLDFGVKGTPMDKRMKLKIRPARRRKKSRHG